MKGCKGAGAMVWVYGGPVGLARRLLLGVSALVAGALTLGCQIVATPAREAEAGFWFEDVSFASPRLGGELTAADLDRVRDVAADEVQAAFQGMRIRITENRKARYHVRVVQQVRDGRMLKAIEVAGQSRGMSGFGGSGVVNFYLLASGAVAYAPADLERSAIVDAIGRGVGRSAVHELTHQFLPRATIDRSRNRASYEFYSAGRPEQFFGTLGWDVAGPLLRERFAQP